MKELVIGDIRRLGVPLSDTEIVERKGLGHPDTICDALAENLSRSLSRHYLERFGSILHHNVDKILLAGGASRPRFGGGEVLEPIEIFLAGRATHEFRGATVLVEELAVETTREWFRANLPLVDPSRHLRIHYHIRPGSQDLAGLFARSQGKAPLSNDTSTGVGFAPLTPLERTVREVERELNDRSFKERFPEYGADLKVMGVRRGGEVSLTVPCAFVDRHVRDMADYGRKKEKLVGLVRDIAFSRASVDAEVRVNTADGRDPSSLYLTVTGTSAESGDDGQVGRGNRANGLITPFRPMTLEASAGKNPVSHTGKLYQATAQRIAERAIDLEGVEEAECYLVSRIGEPIDEPQVVELRLGMKEGTPEHHRMGMEALVRDELGRMTSLWKGFLAGELGVF